MSTSITVKNRLKLFEQGSDQDPSTMSSPRPYGAKPMAPVLQRFMVTQDDLSSKTLAHPPSTQSTSSKPPLPMKSPNLRGGAKIGQSKPDVNQNVSSGPSDTSGTPNKVWTPLAKGVNHSSSPKTVLNGFRNFGAGAHKPATESSSTVSNSSSSSSSASAFPTAATSSPATPPNLRPVTPAKPGVKSPGNVSNSIASRTDKLNSLLSASPVLKPAINSKQPCVRQNSNSSITSSSSSQASCPAESRVPLHGSGKSLDSGSTVPTVPNDKASQDTSNEAACSGQTDRRPTKIAALCQGFEHSRSESPRSSFSSNDPTKSLMNKKVDTTHSSSTTALADDSPDSAEQRRVGGSASPGGSDNKRDVHRTDTDVVERKSDCRQFKKVKLDDLPSVEDVPEKPQLNAQVDLSAIREHYQRALREFGGGNKVVAEEEAAAEEDCDEFYTDAYSVELEMRKLQESSAKRESERVSLIPEMTPEEEGLEVDLPIYDDGMTPVLEDFYNDAHSEMKPVETQDLDDGDVYEDEVSLAGALASEQLKTEEESEQDKKKRLKREEEARKKAEKDRRDKEKEEERKRKKEEKERQNKEKEEKKMKERFKITGDEISVGEGVMIQDVKGKGDNLAAKKGQLVSIIRMDQNPVNKWLVKIEQTIGYMDSSSIEVNPLTIKQTMVKEKKRNSMTSANSVGELDELDQIYDCVPTEDDEEIYEPLD